MHARVSMRQAVCSNVVESIAQLRFMQHSRKAERHVQNPGGKGIAIVVRSGLVRSFFMYLGSFLLLSLLPFQYLTTEHMLIRLYHFYHVTAIVTILTK